MYQDHLMPKYHMGPVSDAQSMMTTMKKKKKTSPTAIATKKHLGREYSWR